MRVAILKNSILSVLAFFVGAQLAWSQAQPADLMKNFSVTDDGKASYTVAIEAPPGTGGLQPHVKLQYNSQSDNGVLGKGWNISGLIYITRCAQDLARDNKIVPVNYSASDRFCMQGQRLIAISGSYGQNGTSYRTERETWSDIKSEGQCGNGPCSFNVRTKDGQKLEFATTDNARIRFDGNGSHVYLWALNRVTDKNGNFWQVDYHRSSTSFQPKSITYTGNDKTGLAPTKSIQFVYEDRNDFRPLWDNGIRQDVKQRIRSIDVRVGADLVRRYQMSYEYSRSSQASLLKKIDLCNASDQCLMLSEFDYNQPTPGINTSASFQLPNKVYYNNHAEWDVKNEALIQDLDGDGILDFTSATCWDKAPCDKRIFRGQRDGGFAYDGWDLPGHVFKNEVATFKVKTEGLLQDLDGDGIADFTHGTCWEKNPPKGEACDLQVWKGTGKGFVMVPGWKLPARLFYNEGEEGWNFKPEGILQDLNGDGVADFSTATCWDKTKPCDLRIWKGTRTGYVPVPGWELPYKVYHNEYEGWRVKNEAILQDLNGDGIADFSRATCWDKSPCDTRIFLGTGDRFVESFSMPAGQFVYFNEESGWRVTTEGVFQDFNGDGIADFTRGTVWNNGTSDLKVYFGTGRGYVFENFNLPGKLFYNKYKEWELKTEGVLYDFNNDGLLDFSAGTVWDKGRRDLTVFHGSGRDLGPVDFVDSGYSLPDRYFFNEEEGYRFKTEGILRDMNGDGAIDYSPATCYNDGPCSKGVYLNKSVNPDTLKTIRNRVGGLVQIDYKALTQKDVHTRSENSEFPILDTQSPTYVVSHYSLSDGREATYNFDYHYTGAKVSQDGRGWLGFETIAQTNREAQIVIKKFFHQMFPLAGLLERQETLRIDGIQLKLLKRQRYTYDHRILYPGVTVVENITDHQDIYLDGSYDYTLARDYQYDQLGNAILVHDLGDAGNPADDLFTCASFTNDLSSWQLGKITALKVTKDRSSCAADSILSFASASDYKLTRFAFDSEYNLISEERYRDTFNDFVKTSYGYDAYGNRIETRNALGGIESVEFDELTHTYPVKFLSALNQDGKRLSTSATYSQLFGQILTKVDMNGHVSQNRYDDFGRLIERLGPDLNGNLVILERLSYVDCPGSGACSAGMYRLQRSRPSWSESDVASWPWTKIFVDGLNRQYLTQTVGGDQGDRIIERTTAFDNQGRIIQESAPVFQGDPVSWAQHRYDIQSSLQQTTAPDGAVTSYCYGLGDDTLRIQDTCQQEVSQGLSLMRMFRSPEPVQEASEDSYADVVARIEQSIQNQSALTRGNRQTLIAGPDPRSRNEDTSQLNRSLQNYSPQGLLLRDQAIDESEVTYQYNGMGQLTAVKDRSGAQTTYTYDSLGNIIRVNDSSRGIASFIYDELGRLIESRDAKGSIRRTAYDRLNRPVKREVFEAGSSMKPYSSSILAYDEPGLLNGMGQLTSISWQEWDESQRALIEYRKSFAYDAYGRTTLDQLKLKSIRKNRPLEFLELNQEVNYSTFMEYLPTGKIAKRVFPDGAVLSYTYNASLQLEAIELQETKKDGSLDAAKLIGRFSSYTALGQYQKMVYGNGIESRLSYDALGRRIAQETLSKDGVSAERLSYLWNKAGKLYSVEDTVDSSRSQEFYYDMRGRLEGAQGPYGRKSYVYDPSGNPLVIDNLAFEYNPNKAHQIARVLDSSGRELGHYTYDANGNVTSQPVLDSDKKRQELWFYTYDPENRLIEVKKGHSQHHAKLVNRFVYAPSGERIKKIDANGKTTLYVGPGYEISVQGNGKQTHTKHIVESQGAIASFTKDYIRGKQLTLLDQSHHDLLAQAANSSSWEGLQVKVSSWLHLASMGLEEAVGNSILTGWVVVFALVFGWICLALTRIHFGLRRGFVFRQIAHVLAWAILLLANPGCSSPPAWKAGANGQGYPSGERYFHKNHQNSTTLVSDAQGHPVARLSYEPFGKLHVASSSGEDSFRQKYTDKELDSDSGLYYFGSRFYDPITGRFLTPDPAWQYHNPYMIGGNDPLSGIDPDGELFWFLIAVFVGALVGGYVGGAMANGNNFNPAQWDWTSGKTWGAIFAGGILGGLGAGLGAAAAAAGASIRVIIGIEAAIGAAEGLVSGAINGETGLELFTSFLIGAGTGALLGGVFEGAGRALGKGIGSAAGKTSRSADIPSGQSGQLRVFWSGPGAMDAAADYARANGGVTLEMTPMGRALTAMTNEFGFDSMKANWREASEQFARQAEGPVHAFHSADGVRLQSIWTRVEYPILHTRGIDIHYHMSPSVKAEDGR